ncbi:ABC transport ATP-binding protein [Salmonella enterica subsp. enterica]|uniref:ABC transport ATP-binding protein n=1 Tax=Salmonella enterica I TaxID=59201 RepID=A0A3S4F4Y2_SALET|nr:ABC transport ATP-binding protein [Salmonella enterica subsp. enterica]
MLSLQQVTLESARYRWYGARRWSPLLQNVSFDIAPRRNGGIGWRQRGGKKSAAAMPARSAAGKLTLSGGEITLDGNRLDRHTIRQLRGNTFSYVPQGVQALNPMLNIRKHLNRACHLTGRAWDETQMVQLLQQSDLEPTVLERFPRQLSGGMAKRILACHASLSQARYILADEITAWLDTALANQLLEHLRGLCERDAACCG